MLTPAYISFSGKSPEQMKRFVLILGLEKFRVQLSSIAGPKKLVPSGIKTSNPLFFVSPFAFCIIVYVSYSVHNRNVHCIRKKFVRNFLSKLTSYRVSQGTWELREDLKVDFDF